ncbi:PA14 domain-containing protein [Streptomyces sp. NPDC127112]|uniref:PA14 domain-containing protein n=1 Tax=Streptomyces sp. NPDC127112 TaxID=3345364 RepID=UPI00364471DD
MTTNIRRRGLAISASLAASCGVLTAAPASASAAVTCNSPDWTAQYFANTSFSGTPALTACDAAISENFGTGSPAGTKLPKDNFGIRWTLARDFGSGGAFTFTAASQDGIRVYLDGALKVDVWKDVTATQSRTVNLTMPSGKHTLRVDFAAWTGAANVSFGYAPRTGSAIDTVAPLTPKGLTASYDAPGGKASLRWFANAEMDLAGYRVYRRPVGGGWSLVSPSSVLTTTAYTDAPPADGREYQYQVRAVDRTGLESPGSAAVSVTAVKGSAPAGLTVRGDSFVARLAWQPVVGADHYEVFAAADPAGPYTQLGTATQPAYVDGTAPANALRHYRVRSVDAAGNVSPYSAVVTGDGVDRTPPQAPTGVSSYPQIGQTRVYWKMYGFDNDRSNGGRFRVYRSPGKTLDTSALTEVTCAATEFNGYDPLEGMCEDHDMAPGTYQTYAVTAVDGSGNESPLSPPHTVRTADAVAPAPVTGLKATARPDGTLLTWSASPEDDFASYRVLQGVRRADGTVAWQGTCEDGKSDPLAILCPDLPDGQTRVYAVIAKDRWGNQLSPNDPQTATVTEQDLRPTVTVPEGGRLNGASWTGVVYGADAPTLWWQCTVAATCDPIAGYRVSRWNPATGSYEPLHSGLLPASDRSYSDTTAQPGSAYYYTFEALRADGTSVASFNWQSIRTNLV